MSRIRANKITDKIGTGAIELEKGAHPVSYTHLTLPTIYSV